MCYNATGTQELCFIIYCVFLPYCDAELEALAADVSYSPTVEVPEWS